MDDMMAWQFGENLSNLIVTPNFVMIGQKTTNLEGGGGRANGPPHTVVFLK